MCICCNHQLNAHSMPLLLLVGALTECPPTERPSDILTCTERPLDIWSIVTFGHCNILTPIHIIQRFYVQPPPQKSWTLCHL
jgi:hypothetical protein